MKRLGYKYKGCKGCRNHRHIMRAVVEARLAGSGYEECDRARNSKDSPGEICCLPAGHKGRHRVCIVMHELIWGIDVGGCTVPEERKVFNERESTGKRYGR